MWRNPATCGKRRERDKAEGRSGVPVHARHIHGVRKEARRPKPSTRGMTSVMKTCSEWVLTQAGLVTTDEDARWGDWRRRGGEGRRGKAKGGTEEQTNPPRSISPPSPSPRPDPFLVQEAAADDDNSTVDTAMTNYAAEVGAIPPEPEESTGFGLTQQSPAPVNVNGVNGEDAGYTVWMRGGASGSDSSSSASLAAPASPAATAEVTVQTRRGPQRVQLTVHEDFDGTGNAVVFHFAGRGVTWRASWSMLEDEGAAEQDPWFWDWNVAGQREQRQGQDGAVGAEEALLGFHIDAPGGAPGAVAAPREVVDADEGGQRRRQRRQSLQSELRQFLTTLTVVAGVVTGDGDDD
ncbi:hypothetical protein ANO14919_041420 [Xylariales sp. No.14919]|nr:hypothetical protein ANO14919_041420 [Xylariales sp. No.14919]